MKLIIEVDVDIEESGLVRDIVKDTIIDFTRDLLLIGAVDQQIGLVLKSVTYED